MAQGFRAAPHASKPRMYFPSFPRVCHSDGPSGVAGPQPGNGPQTPLHDMFAGQSSEQALQMWLPAGGGGWRGTVRSDQPSLKCKAGSFFGDQFPIGDNRCNWQLEKLGSTENFVT